MEKERRPEQNLPKSFKEYAVYCYKTNNTQALFSKLALALLNFVFVEGVMKMASHVCYEFVKDISTCRRRAGGDQKILTWKEKLALQYEKTNRPLWMSSGLIFRTSSFNNQANPNMKQQTTSGFNSQLSGNLERKGSTIKENSSFFKFRGNAMQLTNTLASRLSRAEMSSKQNGGCSSNHHMNFEGSPLRKRVSYRENNSIVEEETQNSKNFNGTKKR